MFTSYSMVLFFLFGIAKLYENSPINFLLPLDLLFLFVETVFRLYLGQTSP